MALNKISTGTEQDELIRQINKILNRVDTRLLKAILSLLHHF